MNKKIKRQKKKKIVIISKKTKKQKNKQKKKTGVDTTRFGKKVDLASSELKIDKLDIGKLDAFPVDLKKLSDVVGK